MTGTLQALGLATTSATATLTLVELEGLSVSVGGATLLADLSWRVLDGERWVVLGGNGAGKSSVLRLLSGQLTPAAGSGEVLGLDLFDEASRRELASATAFTGPHMPWPDGVTPAEILTRIDPDLPAVQLRAHLGRFGVGHRIDAPASSLSTGERARVGWAAALVSRPDLLLVDEPGHGLDVAAAAALRRDLAAMAGDPAAPATVLVCHDLLDVPATTTHALLLRGGRVVSAGTVEESFTASALTACYGLPVRPVRYGDGTWRLRIPGM